MAIQLQGYQQRVDLGQGVNAPNVKSSYIKTGLGETLQEAAGDLARMQANYERSQKELAETESLSAAAQTRMQLEEAYRNAQLTAKPGADQFTPTFMKQVDEAATKGAEGLTNDEAKRRYRERMDSYKVQIQERALTWEAGERVAKRSRDFQNAADNHANSVYTVDGTNRDLTYRNLSADIDSSLDAIGLPPSTREQLREEAKTKISYAAVQGDLRDRPEVVQDWLVRGNGSDYFSRLRSTESGGRNIGSSTSSAFGPYQFTAGTWRNLIAAHPELGLSEADRFLPQAQEKAIRAFTADNAVRLKAAGIETTNTNMYMAHFLGSGGAVQFIRAFKENPNADARAFVAPAAVNANASIFRPGRTVGDVMALFGQKFGDQITWDKDAGIPAYYADIPFTKRDALYSAAETEMNRRRASGEAAFNQRVQNSLSEYASSGAATSAPNEQEFIAALGVQRGSTAYGEFVARSHAAAAGFQVQRMPLNEQPAFLESLKPKQGDPFFAEKQQGYEKVKVVADQIRQRVLTDFGAHVISYNPDAKAALDQAFKPDAPLEEAQLAATRFAGIMGAEAQRLGVPASSRALLPKAYADMIASQLNQNLGPDANAAGAVAALNAYAARWGDNWNRVYRELKDNLSAPVQVITSGIQPRAAVVLAQVHDKSFDDLTKATMAGSDKKAMVESLQEAFQPYVTSTMWRQGSLPTVGLFFEQAKKLAAVYVSQGQSTDDAAATAFNDLIGFKYRMIDTRGINVRVPKDVDTPEMEELLRVEKSTIINSPRIDVSEEEAKLDPDAVGRLRRRLIDESTWVTLPNDKGVALMVGGQLRNDVKGKPITLSWDELKRNLERYKAETQEAEETRSFWGWGFE